MAMIPAEYVLDTSAYLAFNRRDERLRPWFQRSISILVPLIVVGELRAGFAAGTQATENEALLRRFLDAPNVTTLSLTAATTRQYATTFAALREAGTPIGVNDLWIAALALEREVPLVTLDGDFRRVAGLDVAEL